MRRMALLLVVALAAGCGGDAGDTDAPRAGDGFPVTIEHKFGSTTVRERPDRVVAVGFNDQDFALAVGVTPVGVRQFQGGIDITKRPWAQDELAGAEPQIIGAEEIELEKIAALRPDLILAVYSGLTDDQYATLSKLAPTIAQSDEYVDFGEPWPVQAEVTAEALGRDERRVIDDVEARFAQAREANPELERSTFAFASAATGKVYVYGPQDLRTRFFSSLGLTTPPELERLTRKSFFAEVSEERLRLLDQDVLVLYGSPDDLEAFPLFERLRAVREGRVILLDPAGDVANALGFSSPLSLPYALDRLVPQLTEALDGNV